MMELHILWQRLVNDKGGTCPRCQGTGDEVARTVERLRSALEPSGVTPRLEIRELSEAAFLQQPSESNRIWIDGQPLEFWLEGKAGSSRCCDECGDNDCRTLEVGSETYEVIPEELVMRAGLIAATRILGRAVQRSADARSGSSAQLAVKEIQVFDPALCCSTGVCGVDVDQALITFAADLDWLKSHGVPVSRANLAQQPLVFAQHSQIRHLLQTEGEKALPAILVDGELKSSGNYPSRDELARWAGLGVEASLFTEQVAELVAIGAAIASNCEPCFRFHYDSARKLAVTDADVRRAVDLAQKVKEAPARAVLNLAHRLLDKKNGLSAIGVATAAPAKASACCAPSEAVAGAASTSKCC